eukprot:m.185760 g.185760  ORF g.185760 m.185760 type:complete len:84 (+) comp16553_c0_seq1:957-1208(+)
MRQCLQTSASNSLRFGCALSHTRPCHVSQWDLKVPERHIKVPEQLHAEYTQFGTTQTCEVSSLKLHIIDTHRHRVQPVSIIHR